MLNFIFRVIVVTVLFIIMFSITHNFSPAEVVEKMIEAVKQLWEFISSHFNGDDSPYV